MSWMLRRSAPRPPRGLIFCFCLLAQLAWAQGAAALGPFTHLVLARQLAEPAWANQPAVMAALYAGALAPDAGYYPGAQEELAQAAHLVRPWDMAHALLELAATDEERAFARGYLSHALLDRLGHESLINRLSGRPFSQDPLNHKRVEWGLDCWLLGQPQYQWLWEMGADSPAGLDLWARAWQRAHGVRVPPALLAQAMAAELAEVHRLPRVFWLSGQAKRPGGWAGNGLGWLMDYSLRPAAVGFMAWRGGYMNERAVLSARPAQAQDVADLDALLDQVARQTREAGQGAPLPGGNLDADPACHEQACPEARQALRWLEALAKGS
ncbi:MAG: zinc dependent phospholipase C family protein [Desulfarculus sp.]|nr:zinc dependent phospholipase C family protein [Desulfarculus sp.]